jgi:uncharacterized protein
MENINWRETFNSNRTWKLIGIVVLILIVLKGFGVESEWKGDRMPNTISVSGKGEVVVQPDIVTISFGVSAENLEVAKAQTESATKMNNIVDFLEKNGVAKKDIKTTNYSIYPRYDYTQSKVYPYGGKQILVAYVVSQNVEVKIREISKAGTLLSGVGEYGVTDISGLTFGVDKIDEVSNEARDLAIKDARAEAEVLAKSLGVKLVRIVSFSENSYPMPYYAKEMSVMSPAMGGDAVAPNLQPGENKVVSNVTVTYEIR